MAGYSGTPLPKKLGIKAGSRIALVNAPKDFDSELGELPDNVEFVKRPTKSLDIILFFVSNERALVRGFAKLAASLTANGMIWIAWPKKSSGVVTDLSEQRVRQIGLDGGLVDVKVCAIDETWSGLKFVYRLKDRSSVKKKLSTDPEEIFVEIIGPSFTKLLQRTLRTLCTRERRRQKAL